MPMVCFNNNGFFQRIRQETKRNPKKSIYLKISSDIGDGWEFKSLDNDVPIRSDSPSRESWFATQTMASRASRLKSRCVTGMFGCRKTINAPKIWKSSQFALHNFTLRFFKDG